MRAEIICVGTELLLGNILNTNAKYLSNRLAEMGINVYSQSVVGDNAKRLEKQIILSVSRSDIVILTGGLGPTPDDITKETVAKVLNLELEEDYDSLKAIKEYFARTGREMSENNKKQALKPQGAQVLKNDQGTAPGYAVKSGDTTVILLPGPPAELTDMFEKRVVPILKKFSDGVIVSHNVRIFGVGESKVAEMCGDLLNGENPTVATYASTGEVNVRVTAFGKSRSEAQRISEPVLSKLQKLFGENIYTDLYENLQETVVKLLIQKGKKICTAESCTAGMLSSRITEIPGSSEVFEMGVTAYANYIKVQALGVNEEIINKKGAVCEEVAAEMAVGIRTMCGADIGLGITGVAGPGESEGKPAGLVYIALADSENVYVRKILCRGSNRENTRIMASSTALDMARRYLENAKSIMYFATPIGTSINLMVGYDGKENAPEIGRTRVTKTFENKVYLTDVEVAGLFATDDETEEDVIPEKLELEENSVDYIFDDGNLGEDETSNTLVIDNPNDYSDYISDDFEALAEEGKTETKGKKFLLSFLPCKTDSTFEKVRKSVFLVALLVLIVSTVYLVSYFAEGWLQNKIIKDNKVSFEDNENLEKDEDGVFIGFEELQKQNSDIKAWIKIDGTNIDNPVYQTTDNDYYIDHNMQKESSRYGALFIDKDAEIGTDAESTSQNIVVYGHHMKDGTMFGPLKKYTDINFYKENPIIDFTTLYRQGKYKIFAVFITNAQAKDDNGEVFNYRYPEFSEGAENDFMQWINDIKARSIIDTGVDVVETDEILTLSTCTYEFDDARLVVVARRIRDDETEDITDTSAAVVNKNPLYPQAWYDKFGGKKPTVSSNYTSSENVSSTDVQSETSSNVSSETVSGDVAANTTTPGSVSGGSNNGNGGNTSSAISTSSAQSSSSAVSSGTAAGSSSAASSQPASSMPEQTEGQSSTPATTETSSAGQSSEESEGVTSTETSEPSSSEVSTDN